MLRGDRPELETARGAMAKLFTAGTDVQWNQLLPPHDRQQQPDLPTYAFQRRRYWLQAPRFRAAGDTAAEPGDELWDLVTRNDVSELAETLGLADDAPLHMVLPAMAQWGKSRHERAARNSLLYRVTW